VVFTDYNKQKLGIDVSVSCFSICEKVNLKSTDVMTVCTEVCMFFCVRNHHVMLPVAYNYSLRKPENLWAL